MDESLVAINAFRTARGLAPIDRSLLALDPYRGLDLRLTKSLPIGRDRRLELLIEAFNVTNHVNFRPPFGNPPGAGAPMNAPHSWSALLRATRDKSNGECVTCFEEQAEGAVAHLLPGKNGNGHGPADPEVSGLVE